MKFHEKALKGIIKSESPLTERGTLVEVPYESVTQPALELCMINTAKFLR